MMNNSPEQTTEPNRTEYSVSELSLALKRTVEATFRQVRVRGEISGFKRATSGHCYFKLKDEKAVLDAVCWRGTALATEPEDGLEVICTGRITTYPGRSNYQIVVEEMELAGEGALLKLLEARRKKLDGEGLFAAERKKPLPYLPERIGVVTSPTGAVIRDILHRLNDRFPRHVLLWPVPVQGEAAPDAIAAAIEGFNRLEKGGKIPRPDVLIVARGGGSLEDLWAFNEENVVRAAAASDIPLISAIGHETDTTLIDFASDQRAPTPTAAAEMAVPVRAELLENILDHGRRQVGAMERFLEGHRRQVTALARGLLDPKSLLEMAAQRLDDWTDRMGNAMTQGLNRHQDRLISLDRLLESLSYARVLDRGFALVRDRQGNPLTTATAAKPGMAIGILFQDGTVGAVINKAGTVGAVINKAGTVGAVINKAGADIEATGTVKPPKTKTAKKKKPGQRELF